MEKHKGGINGYAKIVIYKSCKDENDELVRDISLDLIGLNLVKDGWEIDKNNSTNQKIDIYSTKPIKINEELQFLESISISPELLYEVEYNSEQLDNNTTLITTEKRAKGKKIDLDIWVYCIQQNNAVEAIKKTWGRDVNIDLETGELSLVY